VIIDIHTHVFPTECVEDRGPWLKDPQFSLLYQEKKSSMVDCHGLMEYMELEEVSYAVGLSYPWSEKDLAERHNDYLSAFLPNKNILLFGSVPVTGSADIAGTVKTLKERGFHGIGEVGFYHTGFHEPEGAFLDELLLQAGRYNLPVNLHMNEPLGHRYPGKYQPNFELLFEVLEKHPEVTIIFAHWGGGLLFYEMMPEVEKISRNWYYDTAASPYLYSHSIYEKAIHLAGSEKILLGTDFPLLGTKRYLEGLTSLDDETRKHILWKNSAKLLGIVE
jgi:uncharacterized protein